MIRGGGRRMAPWQRVPALRVALSPSSPSLRQGAWTCRRTMPPLTSPRQLPRAWSRCPSQSICGRTPRSWPTLKLARRTAPVSVPPIAACLAPGVTCASTLALGPSPTCPYTSTPPLPPVPVSQQMRPPLVSPTAPRTTCPASRCALASGHAPAPRWHRASATRRQAGTASMRRPNNVRPLRPSRLRPQWPRCCRANSLVRQTSAARPASAVPLRLPLPRRVQRAGLEAPQLALLLLRSRRRLLRQHRQPLRRVLHPLPPRRPLVVLPPLLQGRHRRRGLGQGPQPRCRQPLASMASPRRGPCFGTCPCRTASRPSPFACSTAPSLATLWWLACGPSRLTPLPAWPATAAASLVALPPQPRPTPTSSSTAPSTAQRFSGSRRCGLPSLPRRLHRWRPASSSRPSPARHGAQPRLVRACGTPFACLRSTPSGTRACQARLTVKQPPPWWPPSSRPSPRRSSCSTGAARGGSTTRGSCRRPSLPCAACRRRRTTTQCGPQRVSAASSARACLAAATWWCSCLLPGQFSFSRDLCGRSACLCACVCACLPALLFALRLRWVWSCPVPSCPVSCALVVLA